MESGGAIARKAEREEGEFTLCPVQLQHVMEIAQHFDCQKLHARFLLFLPSAPLPLLRHEAFIFPSTILPIKAKISLRSQTFF